MAQNYFDRHMTAMDRSYYHQLDTMGHVYHPTALHEDAGGAKTSLGPREIGTPSNPFQNQLQALQAKIREGASLVEFSFGGVGKGNSQSGTPEMYGAEEREAMRTLAEYNDVRTMTHASFGMQGLAGFGQNGFDRRAQHQNMEEVKRAVDFASQASTGGAVVVHTGEWERPISEQQYSGKDGDFGLIQRHGMDEKLPGFQGYADERNRAILPVVDSRTGEIIGGIRKDQEIYEPEWLTVSNYQKEKGKSLTGKDSQGHTIDLSKVSQFDYVDAEGNVISRSDPRGYEKRSALWDDETKKFRTHKLDWQDIVKRTEEYNRVHPDNPRTPEQLYAEAQIENAVLQQRGQASFASRDYDENVKRKARYQKALAIAERMGSTLSEEDQWQMQRAIGDDALGMLPPETKDVRAALKELIDQADRQLRYIVESSASAEASASQLEARKAHLATMEDYGIKQTGRALGELGEYAMVKSAMMRENVKKKGGDLSKYEDIYIAPENLFPESYGSHPDEIIRIVQAGRKEMVERLTTIGGKSKEEAEALAKKHIKSTIDIGHLNMWKAHMTRKDGETDAQLNKRFEQWTMNKLDAMHNAGVLGHFHLTDNFGFNDEHLTPGQGNAPIRSFVKKLEELGYNEVIAEPGSFNAGTMLGETWSFLGMNGFKQSPMGGRYGAPFNQQHWRHAALYAPANYAFGNYVPSNEWTLWSGTQLE